VCHEGTSTDQFHRDGKTPEEQTKQILQIAAILPGQKPDSRFSIPSRKNSSSAPLDSMHKLSLSDDQDTTSTQHPASIASNNGAAGAPQVSRSPRRPKTMESVEEENIDTESSRDAIRRQDSQTNDMDVFHDAES